MAYQPSWAQGDANGRVLAGQHVVRATDMLELASAVNRRRRLVYLAEEDFSSQAAAGAPIRRALVDSQQPPPFTNLRYNVKQRLLNAQAGGMGGDPASPAGLEWLFPEGSEEGKTIVTDTPDAGEVNLFTQLNGGTGWTDPNLLAGEMAVRAVHVNELRTALEWLRRGQWTLPIYGNGGIFSLVPDMPWLANALFSYEGDEVRCVGIAILATAESPPRGLTGVTVRSGSIIRVTADMDCQVEIYRCKRQVDLEFDPPTWELYDPGGSLAWAEPGGLGAGEAELLGSVACTAHTPSELTGDSVRSAVQAMVDGDPQSLLFRRGDEGLDTIEIASELVVEFDLDSPPN